MALFLALLTLLASIPTALAIREWRLWWQLQWDSQQVRAQLQHHWETRLGLSRYYFLICEAEVLDSQGQDHFLTFAGEVEREVYQAAVEGGGPVIYYASANPQRFRLAGQPFEQWRWTGAALFAWAWVGLFMAVALGV